MNREKMICAAILLGLVGCSMRALNGQQRADSMGNFLQALASSTEAARVDYIGNCDAVNPNRIISPEVKVTNTNSSLHGLKKVRAMLGNAKNIVVEESVGVIRIRIGAMDENILHTRMKLLKLTPNQQFDPSEAILALENSQEFRQRLQSQTMRIALTSGGLESMPTSGEPYLPSAMQNLTVDQVLTEIARTFSGTVLYGECRDSKGETLVNIRFVGKALGATDHR